MSASRPTPRPWRLPRPKPRRVRTPVPVAPPSSRPPSSRRLHPPPIAFETVFLRGRSIGVSASVLARFPLSDLLTAIEDHRGGRGAHQTKHRFRAGTVTVLSNSARGETFIVSPVELRLLIPPKRPR